MGIVRQRVVLALAVSSVLAGVGALGASPAHAATTILVPSHVQTIQAAIDAAVNGQAVVVAPGTYFENIDFKGKAIEVRSAEGGHSTIIDGGGTGTVVTFKSGEGRGSVLRGFTITGGLVDGTTGVLSGGGVGIDNSSPTVTENKITGNDAAGHAGAGIGAAGGAPRIYDNWILENTTGELGGGGGLAVINSAAEIERNVFESNTAAGGGGVVVIGGTPVIRGNALQWNHAAFHGGGLLVHGTGPGGLIVNNFILENTSESAGGGVHVAESSPPYLLNNTIVDNEAPSGAGVNIEAGGVRLTNNLVFGPAAHPLVRCAPGLAPAPVFSHNDVYNAGASPYLGCADPTGTNGNVSVDHRVAPSGSLNTHPQVGSPIVDAGSSTAPSIPATDVYLAPRVADGDGDGVAAVDIGAVELPAVPVNGVRYHPVTPTRILDTRSGAPVGAASTLGLQVTGQGGVPASGVTAVVLNVTVTEPTAPSWLTAWPAGVARPTASNLNFVAGRTVPNLVVVKVGEGGKVNLYNDTGSTHVVADVAGWYGGPTEGSRYFGVTPARILDSRTGAKLGPASTVALQVTGRGGVPASGVTAVVLNVTVAEPTAEGWLTAWPAGVARPTASNLNFVAGQTVPNLVMVKVGEGGKVNLYNSAGATHVVADVAGWYGSDGGPGGAGFSGATPSRILDTRAGLGAPAAKVGPAQSISLQVTGHGGVPVSGVKSVVLNVTVTEPTAPSWLTVWPAGKARPLASNLNYLAGDTTPNLVVVDVGTDGKVNLYNAAGSTHVVADVAGWLSA